LYDTLFEEKRTATTELETVRRESARQKEKNTQQAGKIKELQRELNSKEEIVSVIVSLKV